MADKKVKSKYICRCCNMKFDSACNLYGHVMGNKHRERLSYLWPEMVPVICNFQNFLDVYMKDVPLLGLEYIEDYQEDNEKCTCSLCSVDCRTKNDLLGHLLTFNHMKKYVDKHHPVDFGRRFKHLPKRTKLEMVNAVALQVQAKYGRQPFGSMVDYSNSAPAKVAKYTDSEESSSSHFSGEPALSQQRVPKANPQEQIKAIQADVNKKLKFLQFKHNLDFMNYLREFEIHSDEDAKFMDKMTKNCTKVLLEFKEEQINTEFSQKTPAHRLQAPVHIKGQESDSHVLETGDKTDSCLSRAEADLSEGTANPVSQDLEKSDTIDVLLSSIKNTEESEVIGVFESIAATNPAFKGIDIAKVMKYLQETAKLKKT